MGSVVINKPEFSDVEELKLLFSRVIRDTFNKEVEGEQEEEILNEIDEKSRHLLEALNSNDFQRLFFVARVQGIIVGTIAYGPCGELIVQGTAGVCEFLGEIGTVYVLPEYQNQGIGTNLMEAMFLELQNRGIHEFCLDSGYPRAQKIWHHKFGEPAVVMKDYWGKGYDHMIWVHGILYR